MLPALPIALSLLTHVTIACCVMLAVTITAPMIIRRLIGVRAVPRDWRERVLYRFQTRLGYVPWRAIPPFMFARFKLKLDPMFAELPELIGHGRAPAVALDIGCGFGVTGCTLQEWFPEVRILGIEPGSLRSWTARRTLNSNAAVVCGLAPDALSQLPEAWVDLALMLDVTHLIPDHALAATLNRVRERLSDDGVLLARVNVPQGAGQSVVWHLDWFHRLITGARTYHRPLQRTRDLFESAELRILDSRISGGKPEMVWLVASRKAIDEQPVAGSMSNVGTADPSNL